MTADAKVRQLEARLRAASDAYYNTGEPTMSDAEYDALADVLRELAPDSAALSAVGAPVPGAKVPLPYPMMSLDKVKDAARAQRWADKHPGPYTVSDKLDGTSAMFASGKMYRRGTGDIGADVSHLVAGLVPTRVRNADLAVRGEIVMRKADFARLKARDDSVVDARSLVNALENRKTVEPGDPVLRAARFVAYEVVHPRMDKAAQFAALKAAGYETAWHATLSALSGQSLTDLFTRRRAESPYNVDGLVVEAAGAHALVRTRNPDYAFAFKAVLPDQGGETTVIDVVYESSRDGRLTPRVSFEPVVANGVTMRWATAHNARFVQDAGIGPGARVVIVRSGDVIPKIVGVPRTVAPKLPPPVPAWSWDANGVHAVLTLLGDQGRVKLLLKFLTALGVEHAKETTLTKLYEAGYGTVSELLAATPAQLSAVPGVGNLMAEKLTSALRAAVRSVDPVAMMVASNAFGSGVGERKLRALHGAIGDFTKLSGPALRAAVLSAPGFQDATADKIVAGVPAFRDFMAAHPEITLARAAPRSQEPPRARVVFTGFRDAALEAAAGAAGYEVASSVSATTHEVVARDTTSGTGKVKRARELGVPVVSEAAFRARLASA